METKKIFYNILAFVISIGLFSSCSYSNSQSSQKHNKSVMVRGNAVINVKPDTAILEVYVKTKGENIINIQSENNKIMDNIVEIIEKLGVDKKDIYISDYNFNTIFYTLNTEISIKVRDINKTGEILNKVNNIATKSNSYIDTNIIEFTVRDYDTYYKEALKEAIEDGNNKAKEISKKLGVDLGSAIKIDEDQDYIHYFHYGEDNNFANINYDEKSNNVIEANKLIEASVTMTFEY